MAGTSPDSVLSPESSVLAPSATNTCPAAIFPSIAFVCMKPTDQQKHDLAITIRGANPRTPIQAPTEVPVATILSVNGWTADVQISTAGSDRRGLPDGVAGINIYSFQGPTPTSDPLQWVYEGESSRSRFKIAAPPETPVGTKIWYAFCFKSPRFQTGPACAGVPVVVGGGVPETNVG